MLSTEEKALFPGKYTIDQPHFQENIPLNQWCIANVLQIWPTGLGYEELVVGFEPIKKGKIFY